MAAESALTTLHESAGPSGFDEALSLLGKLFRNIVDHPAETKFRRLNPQNAKLQNALFRHAGAPKLLAAAGFVKTEDGFLELPQDKSAAFLDVNSIVQRRLRQQLQQQEAAQAALGVQTMTSAYRDAVNGGARGAGLAEMAALLSMDGGPKALQILEKILTNIRRYPDTKSYQSVNLAKPAAQKVLPALPLLSMVGFVRRQQPAGEDWLELPHVDLNLLERLQAMIWWATRPEPPKLQPNSERMSHVLGAVLGAAVGDALGAPLAGKREFEVSAKEIDKVMEMCGGGIWGMAPGQTSDTTELTLCLADALASIRASGDGEHFPLEDIAVRYGKWGKSGHFHAEQACGQAFRGALSAEQTVERAKNQNKKAVGVGALTRCPMLAAFTVALHSAGKAAELARVDASLSHPNLPIVEASAAYVVLARSLMMMNGDRTAALAELRTWMERELAEQEGGQSLAKADGGPAGYVHLAKREKPKTASGKEEEYVPAGASLVATKEIMSWVAMAFDDKKDLPFAEERFPSSARVAFTHALRHVKLGSSFEDAMRATLAGGGDCSGNCAIVGGLIGAAVGLEGIPPRWIRAVLTSETVHGQMRPQEYHPGRLPELVQKIIEGR